MFPWSGSVVCLSVVLVLVPAVSVAASVEPSMEPRVCSVEMMETVGEVMLWVLDAPELRWYQEFRVLLLVLAELRYFVIG